MKDLCVCAVCPLPDGGKTAMTQCQDMSEKQLLQVAKRLGKEWKQVAIYLDLNSRDLDDIQAAEKSDVTMQKLKMLVEWKSRSRPGEATANHLYNSVEELDDLPNEVRQTLQGNKLHTFLCFRDYYPLWQWDGRVIIIFLFSDMMNNQAAK